MPDEDLSLFLRRLGTPAEENAAFPDDTASLIGIFPKELGCFWREHGTEAALLADPGKAASDT